MAESNTDGKSSLKVWVRVLESEPQAVSPDSTIKIRVQVLAGEPQMLSVPCSFEVPVDLRPNAQTPRPLPGKEASPSAARKRDSKPVAWYVKTSRGEIGPMHIIQVAKAVGMGKILPGTLLRNSGLDVVVYACDIPGLFPVAVCREFHRRLDEAVYCRRCTDRMGMFGSSN